MANDKVDPRVAKAQALTQKVNQQYGHLAGMTGDNGYSLQAVPSGSLMYDFQSMIGGHPIGQFVEVFGAPSIGKTTIMGSGALRGAQSMGMLTGVIALEPNVDENWLIEHGVNLDYNIIARPDNGEEAFGILHDWVYSGDVGYILFDSIGALSSNKANESDKSQAYGESALITWGVKRVMMRAWKNDVGVMFVNQQRDDTKARIAGLVESGGGWGMKHCMTIRTHIKPGKDRYTVKMSDGMQMTDVAIGGQVVCNFKKHKAGEAMGKSARFDFYHKHADGYPFGVDVTTDVINTGKVSGVIEQAGAYYKHRTFPGGKIKSKEGVGEYLRENSEALAEIRKDVMDVMVQRSKTAVKTKPDLVAVS